MAQREIGLAIGEPPTTKGYPPSVFGQLPQILERVAPARSGGSITGLYTVLVEGDDMTDPIADAARGLLDGHIILSRPLALRGHFPAIDVLQSLSRLEGELATPQEIQAPAKCAVGLQPMKSRKNSSRWAPTAPEPIRRSTLRSSNWGACKHSCSRTSAKRCR